MKQKFIQFVGPYSIIRLENHLRKVLYQINVGPVVLEEFFGRNAKKKAIKWAEHILE